MTTTATTRRTPLAERRASALEAESARSEAYHNGADTVVLGIRLTRKLRDAIFYQYENSELGGSFSEFCLGKVVDGCLRVK